MFFITAFPFLLVKPTIGSRKLSIFISDFYFVGCVWTISVGKLWGFNSCLFCDCFWDFGFYYDCSFFLWIFSH